MSTAYGAIARPETNGDLNLPLYGSLKEGTRVKLVAVDRTDDKLVSTLRDLLNAEIEDGCTYPQEEILSKCGLHLAVSMDGTCFWC